MPSAAHAFWMASALPCGIESVSKSRRPMSVDLPWSTWPTTTTLRREGSEAALEGETE